MLGTVLGAKDTEMIKTWLLSLEAHAGDVRGNDMLQNKMQNHEDTEEGVVHSTWKEIKLFIEEMTFEKHLEGKREGQ